MSLQRYINQKVEIIYSDSKNKITQRTIKVIGVVQDKVRAYCYKSKAPRVFQVSGILAVMPVRRHAG